MARQRLHSARIQAPPRGRGRGRRRQHRLRRRHFGGRPLVERFGRHVFLTPTRLDHAEAYFNEHGGKIVTVEIYAGFDRYKWFAIAAIIVVAAIVITRRVRRRRAGARG